MATILGDWFKDVGKGLGEVFDGDILEGVGSILGGTLKGAGRTIGFAGKTFGNAGKAVGDIVDAIFEDGDVSADEIDDDQRAYLLIVSAVSMLAKMAKADGRVSMQETAFLSDWIASLELTEEDSTELKKRANEAKTDEHSIYDYAALFYESANYDGDICANFYLNLFRMALSDGELSDEEAEILASIPECLGLDEGAFQYVCEHPEILSGEEEQESAPRQSAGSALQESYALLECSPDATDAEVKKAYRRMIAQYHPDKIAGKDLAPGFTEFANQQTARIQAAYETIKTARGMR